LLCVIETIKFQKELLLMSCFESGKRNFIKNFLLLYLSTFVLFKSLFIEPSAIGAASVGEPIAAIFVCKFAVRFANVEIGNGYAVLFSLQIALVTPGLRMK
jgi:hypothetical protein